MRLADELHLMVPAHDVRLGEQAAVCIHRQLAPERDPAVLGESRGLAATAESEALERRPDEDGESVVDEERVDVRGRYLGHLIDGLEARLVVEYSLLGHAKPRVGPDELFASRRKPLHAADVDRRLSQVACALFAGDDYTGRAVVDQAVVEETQRITY